MKSVESVETMVVGVDTHKESHSAALLSPLATVEGELVVGANPTGYRALLKWARARSRNRVWAVEGTGSYGAGLATFLGQAGEEVYEGDRPQRRARGASGKSDPLDAIRVAREWLARDKHALPRARGRREAMRVVLTAREGASSGYRQGLNQLYALVTTAPEPIRERLRGLKGERLVKACIHLRRGGDVEAVVTTLTLRRVSKRLLELQAEVSDYDAQLGQLVATAAPRLLAEPGVGPVTGAQLLVSWSHAGRLRNENSFAALAGVAPIPASSGRVVRHRLNHYGDRQLNRALHVIAVCRSSYDPKTQAYISRRTAEGRSAREIRRCLKRYIARRLYRLLEGLDKA